MEYHQIGHYIDYIKEKFILMKNLKNWDYNTWLSSKKYILSFHKFLKKEVKFHKEIKILDIGCGRGKIISFLSKKYKLNYHPVGVDIVDHKVKNNRIQFIKKDAVKFLKSSKNKFDLIIFKQSIHFFRNSELRLLLHNARRKLNHNAKIIICTLNSSNTCIPTFKLFDSKLKISLKKDKAKINLIKKLLKNYKIRNFKFKVNINKNSYVKMIKNRFISCLLKFSKKEIENGVVEINKKYNKKIIFFDQLLCLVYKKK